MTFVQTVPHFFGQFNWDESRCTLADYLQRTCIAEAPLAAMQQRQAVLRALLSDVAATTGNSIVDFGALICPDGICRTADQRGIVYRDAGHIANTFSATMAAEWISILGNN